jgi:hypothetical protein
MKKFLWLFAVLCFLAFSAVQAQVLADFEVEGAGVQGFSNPGWGPATTAVERIADPTGRSVGVLAVSYDGSLGERGNFEKQDFSPKNAHVLSMKAYLPADFPDDGYIRIAGQDNARWSDSRVQSYQGVNLPKQAWVTLNFHIYNNYLANPSGFNPYDPNKFGRVYFQIEAGTFNGQVLFDELTLLGDVPRVQADFETGLSEWANSGWSPGISTVEQIVDPNDATNHVMSVGLDAALGNTGQLSSGQINLTTPDHVIAFKIWVPTTFPDENVIRIVGQDRKNWADGAIQVYSGADLVKAQWNEIYLDILRFYETDSSKFVPYSSGGFGRIWIGFENNTTFTGAIYMDDIILLQPAPPPTAELLSPAITTSAGVDTLVDPFTGEVFYHNDITWTDLAADIGETYSLYYSESGPITDVTAPGVIQISKNIGRGTQAWHHRMYTTDGATKTVYYAMTVTGIEGGGVVEKPVRDGISNSGAVTAKTTLLYELPFVTDFNFAADGYLDEFEALTTKFPRLPLRNQIASGDADQLAAWTTESTDLNFKGYVVMDANNLYIGMDVTDDLPHGDAQCWAGDGFDFMSGLYDVKTLTSLWRGNDQQQGAVTDPNTGGGFRVGSAVGASQGTHIQVNGYMAWDPDGAQYAQDVFEGGYIVEMKIPFASMNTRFNGAFTPAEGMLLCGKFDVNDNDTESTTGTRSLQMHWGDVPSNYQGWQRAECWAAPFILTSEHIVGVESRDNASAPYAFNLSRNYPNPFNPSTTLSYQLPNTTNVSIAVYDLLGKEIQTLENGKKAAGSYKVTWDGTDNTGRQVSSGVYFCKMVTPEFSTIQKMMLLK